MAMTRGRPLGFDGGVPAGVVPMIRLFLLGVLLFAFVMGLQKGWLRLDWGRIRQDLNINLPSKP